MSQEVEALAVRGAEARRGRASGPAPAALVIEPAPRVPRVDLGELWAYRGLFFFLVWRDVKVRYAQTVLGAAWAVLQPVLTMVVFSVVFGRLARLPSDGVPYPAFVLAALVPWTYFSTALAGAGSSLVNDRNLITKVYFPRLVIPFAPILAAVVDFGVAFALLLAVVLAYGMVPGAVALGLVPALVVLMVLAVAGAGCWLAALTLQYRDFRYVVPFMLQVWMYASPIAYPASLVPARWRTLYALNPMVGVVEGMRAALFGKAPVPWAVLGVSAAVSAVLFVSGVLYFRHTERVFADVV